ncbi:DUF3667 domain-containing protein [Psychroserpens sp. AS72]|uniref:DUF3667 domain-containing protein n=1 Tax=Psychroserpens sp. AS72 TaxID=3135775 RepID=UPI00317126D7
MNCKNCNNQLPTESEFCNICGGKVIRNRLTFKNIFEHISETFFNYDNKLLRTCIDLFRKPELVIDGYIEGIRKRYVNPISFFGISLTLSGLSIFIIKKYYLEYLDFSNLFKGEYLNNPMSQQMMQNSSSTSFEYGSLILSAMIPLMALVSVIVFYDKRYNFTEHIIVYLYSMSALTIVSIFAGQIILLIAPTYYLLFAMLLYLALFIYHCYAFKRIFKLSVGDLILKILIFVIVFFVFYIIFGIIMAVIMYLNGDFDQMFQAKEAAKEITSLWH